MNNYIDYKVTLWQRLYFKDDADMQAIANDVEGGCSIQDFISEDDGFDQCGTLYDTEDELTPDQNGGYSTVEIHKDGELIYQNGKG